MKLLCIETATPAGAVAIVVDGTVLGERVVTNDRQHTETIIPATKDLLGGAELTPGDLDGIVVDVGPGLFTGLRVGIATARSLAFATGTVLYPVSSLEVLANDPALASVEQIVSVVDGRRGEVFVQSFRRGSSIEAIDEPRVMKPGVLRVELESRSDGVTLSGDGAERYRSFFDDLKNISLLSVPLPSPSVAGSLVERGVIGPVANPADLMPIYLRDPDAIANFTVAWSSTPS